MGQFPNSNLERFALPPQSAGGMTGPRDAAAARIGRPPMIDVLGTADQIFCGFTRILVPDGTNFSAFPMALYTLLHVRVPRDYPQGFGLVAVSAETVSPDSSGSVGDSLQWGTNKGDGAAILVCRNQDGLPEQGAWGPGNLPVPGIAAVTNAIGAQSRYIGGGIIDVIRFGTGTYNDARAMRLPHRPKWNPFVVRFGEGSTLSVVLAVRGSQVQNATGNPRYIYGSADVNLIIGRTEMVDNWTP